MTATDGFESIAHSNNGVGFLTPTTLSISQQAQLKVVAIGSCMLTGAWNLPNIGKEHQFDIFVVNNVAKLPELSSEEIRSYDFAIIQLPFRSILPDSMLWYTPYSDPAAYENAFEVCCQRIDMFLDRWMIWNREHGLLTFVSNFLVPQCNPMGRLFARYDLKNIQYFVERLNQHLERSVRKNRNAYIFDLDGISASLGRRYIQEDHAVIMSHGSFLQLPNTVTDRIEPLPPMADHYEVDWPTTLPPAIWSEILAMYRSVRQVDIVKLVVVDLDDTLWRGISGDMSDIDPAVMLEGWPLGFVEALIYLRRRGILLAVISKNDENRVREIWPRIFEQKLSLDAFATVLVNWRPKAENMAQILETMNLLPRSVVFIDDNPVERAAMQAAFPDMRILGRYPYYLRRILLWSAETQVAAVSEESSRRTEMMKRQFEREDKRREMSREDFLRSAAPRVTLFEVNTAGHPRFGRIIELINKTNQFNTTGKRWSLEEMQSLLAEGGGIFAFEVADSFTTYGLVGVVLVSDGEVIQWAMSCRVLGYDIEHAVMAHLVAAAAVTRGRLVETEVNFPCRSLFRDCGFVHEGGQWVLFGGAGPAVPGHVALEIAQQI